VRVSREDYEKALRGLGEHFQRLEASAVDRFSTPGDADSATLVRLLYRDALSRLTRGLREGPRDKKPAGP
jgi:hypothetical protein